MTTSTDNSLIDTTVAFGRVVTVRPVPTRGVTQVVIEIPDEFHVQATTLLFNKDAFVLAANPGVQSSYGVVPLAKMEATGDSVKPASTSDQTPAHVVRHHGLKLTVEPSRWLGIQCQTAQFMHWIGARSAQEATEKVRGICGVQSRRDIEGNPQALEIFINKIYSPFIQQSKADQAMLNGARAA